MKLFPEKHQELNKSLDLNAILKIQANYRRHLAQSTYRIKLEKARKNPHKIFLKKWPCTKDNLLCIISCYYLQDIKTLLFRALAHYYSSRIEDLTIKISDIDKHGFEEKLSNVKRLADLISSYVKNNLFF